MPRVRERIAQLYPGAELIAIEALPADSGATSDSTGKAAGYGLPIRITLIDRGTKREVVWRVASANEFGHDRRSDRAAGLIQAFDDFAQMPRHVRALDLGVVGRDGELVSITDGAEHYLITSFAPGRIYANDLRRIAADGSATPLDVARTDALAAYLAALHVPVGAPGVRYRRALRDLVGSGEGIFGIIDGYPADTPGAPVSRLRELEAKCVEWRWRLRDHDDRLVRTHGDFHPFNIVFDGGTDFTVLDASRGGCGDPADDLTALAINYVLFALEAPASWIHGLGVLWRHWWHRYLALRPDVDALATAPPYFAWRALVVCNPVFYPKLAQRSRDRLLGFAEDLLDAKELDPVWAEELFS